MVIKSKYWKVHYLGACYANDLEYNDPLTEQEVRQDLREVLGVDKLPAGTEVYTDKPQTPIATNQSNLPFIIEVYDIDEADLKIHFASYYMNGRPCSKRSCSNNIYIDDNERAYFRHLGDKYYLDECLRTGI